ncbi:hypothetical protein AX17_005637 [Amanita inopinata Kibby_2008]|nr:hypothetical protein AX17_005637 [Amanita inopinata Kibby_2008]
MEQERKKKRVKNKSRLFIILQHRLDNPRFHWSLLLAPKLEADKQDDSYLFNVVNTFQLGVPFDPMKGPDWRYEHRATNVMKCNYITARVLVAKLSPCEDLMSQAERIHEIIQGIRIVQGDKNWTCRVWIEEALQALNALGGNFSTIPEVTIGGGTEADILAFAQKAKNRLIKGKCFRNARQLPLLDIRIRSLNGRDEYQ